MAATLRKRSVTEFGNLPRGGGESIQVANYFQTSDATGTPQTSPLAYSGATIYNLVIPQGAVQLILFPSTDLRVSEIALATQYDIIPAGTKETIPCAGMGNIYITRDAADGSLRFKFIFV